ncbi:MAG TPA: STAS domain-containing protein [Acidimicrobiia bacterium]|nr:STAS domain-containing protein [Acidimicrobiia bacterium]
MQDLATRISVQPGRVVVSLSGCLDVWHIPALAESLCHAVDLAPDEIVVDCAGLVFVDAAARRFLNRLGILAPLDHVRVVVVRVPPAIKRRWEQVGLTRVLDVK